MDPSSFASGSILENREIKPGKHSHSHYWYR